MSLLIKLKKEYIDTLKICLEHHKEDLLWVVESEKDIKIDEALGNELREAVGNELMEYGFCGDIPNKYGLLLEDLIDVIGRQFINNI